MLFNVFSFNTFTIFVVVWYVYYSIKVFYGLTYSSFLYDKNIYKAKHRVIYNVLY